MVEILDHTEREVSGRKGETDPSRQVMKREVQPTNVNINKHGEESRIITFNQLHLPL